MTGCNGKFDLQLLSQCGRTYNCLSRSVPEIHLHVAGTLSNQRTTTAQTTVCAATQTDFADQTVYLI